MQCIDNLQKLKNDKNISQDEVKIQLSKTKYALKKKQAQLLKRNQKQSILEVPDLEKYDIKDSEGIVDTPDDMKTIQSERQKNEIINNYVKRLVSTLI